MGKKRKHHDENGQVKIKTNLNLEFEAKGESRFSWIVLVHLMNWLVIGMDRLGFSRV